MSGAARAGTCAQPSRRLPAKLWHRAGTKRASDPVRQAQAILHWGLAALLILTGSDKLLEVLADWTIYVSPLVVRLSPVAVDPLMKISGVIEIGIGLFVAVRPRVGAYVLAAYLLGVIVNLVLAQAFYDIALRDLGLALAALALGRLSARRPLET
jgi:hypothetical protein